MRKMESKYDRLRRFLGLTIDDEIKLSLAQIEMILGDKLEPSAYDWTNQFWRNIDWGEWFVKETSSKENWVLFSRKKK